MFCADLPRNSSEYRAPAAGVSCNSLQSWADVRWLTDNNVLLFLFLSAPAKPCGPSPGH